MLKDCNLDFPRIDRKVGREEGQNNINSLAARNTHNNNTLSRIPIKSHKHACIKKL